MQHLPSNVIVIKNNTLGQIKWEQMVYRGNPEYGVELEPIDFARFAEACGSTGFYVEDPNEIDDVMGRALRTSGPVLIEALVRGEPNGGRIATTIFRDRITDMLAPSGEEHGLLQAILRNKRGRCWA